MPLLAHALMWLPKVMLLFVPVLRFDWRTLKYCQNVWMPSMDG